jgi:hypothetical protein
VNGVMKLRVVTEGGRIVGTQFVLPAGPGTPSVSANLQAGPGQHVHELDMEPPALLRTVDQIHAFHEQVAKALGIERLYGRG